MPVSIRDLANKLNLSITTVSRALDGYSDVSTSTRQRVIDAAREMGYQPTYAARQLRRKRSDAIGYILPTSSPRFSDPFYSIFLAGLCDEAAEHRLDLIVSSCPPASETEQMLYTRWFNSRRVDGWILNRTRVDDWRIQFLTQNQIPFTALGRPTTTYDFPTVILDEQSGYQRLIQHLAERGHQRIAYIGASPDLVIQQERFTGYRKGLELSDLSFDSMLVRSGNLTEDSGHRAAQELLDLSNPPSAILACNDLMAIGALSAAQEKGMEVGKDLAIAGHDGIKETAYTNPPLTTLSQPTYDIARKLTRMLIQVLQEKDLPEKLTMIQPDLILRPSTG
jgi:LacI family transcriptional regulator